MSDSSRVVFFDVDGVLIDSLPEHLRICTDKARDFKLELRIPTVDEFRGMVSSGKKVSPMREFFLAVGFPESCVERAVADYEQDFMARYEPRPFDGLDRMLRAVRDAGSRLGLVTSNTRRNVVPALADSMELFDKDCLFFYDTYEVPPSKSWCLTRGAETLGAVASNCIFVGDQPADVAAAVDAGWQFLGVAYGWGILKSDARFETANTIEEIPDKIARINARAS